jgi:multidrug efflux system membrane fusion protein
MKVSVLFTAIENKNFNAVVTEVAPSININNSTYPITVVVTDTDARIRSGMAANVTFQFASKKNNNKMLVVPYNAVGENSKGRFVFTIEEKDNTAIVIKKKITVGDLIDNKFEVLSGLKIGQKVATAGLQTLLDGQKVKLN